MKHVLLFLLTLCLVFSLSACGVSQSDYDTLLEEKNKLTAEIESLSSENESLTSDVKSLSGYKENQVFSEMEDSYIKAWAATSFGDNSIFLSDGSLYFQCIAEKTYDISDEGISELWSDFCLSVTTLGVLSSNIKYETISVKFFDPSGTYILDIVLKKNGDSVSLDAITSNVLYADEIIPALSNLTN